MCLVIFCFTSRSLEFLGRGVYEAMLILEVKGQTGGGGGRGYWLFYFFSSVGLPIVFSAPIWLPDWELSVSFQFLKKNSFHWPCPFAKGTGSAVVVNAKALQRLICTHRHCVSPTTHSLLDSVKSHFYTTTSAPTPPPTHTPYTQAHTQISV